MLPSKKRTSKRNRNSTKGKKWTPAAPSPGEIQRFFQLPQSGSLEFKMADTCASRSEGLDLLAYPASPAGSSSSEIYPTIPPAFLSDPRNSLHLPLTYRADAELKSILQALPMKADIEDLIGRVEATHRKEHCAVKQDVQPLTTRLMAGETSLYMIDQRVTALETLKSSHTEAAVSLQLHLEEMEDQSRQNNLWLRGLPEATGPADLADTVTDIFKRVMGKQLLESLELDRIHIALGPRSNDPTRPQPLYAQRYYSPKSMGSRRPGA